MNAQNILNSSPTSYTSGGYKSVMNSQVSYNNPNALSSMKPQVNQNLPINFGNQNTIPMVQANSNNNIGINLGPRQDSTHLNNNQSFGPGIIATKNKDSSLNNLENAVDPNANQNSQGPTMKRSNSLTGNPYAVYNNLRSQKSEETPRNSSQGRKNSQNNSPNTSFNGALINSQAIQQEILQKPNIMSSSSPQQYASPDKLPVDAFKPFVSNIIQQRSDQAQNVLGVSIQSDASKGQSQLTSSQMSALNSQKIQGLPPQNPKKESQSAYPDLLPINVKLGTAEYILDLGSCRWSRKDMPNQKVDVNAQQKNKSIEGVDKKLKEINTSKEGIIQRIEEMKTLLKNSKDQTKLTEDLYVHQVLETKLLKKQVDKMLEYKKKAHGGNEILLS